MYAAARDGMMPALLAMIHVKRFTPLPSMVFTVSKIYCLSSMIVQVRVVFRKTVVGD